MFYGNIWLVHSFNNISSVCWWKIEFRWSQVSLKCQLEVFSRRHTMNGVEYNWITVCGCFNTWKSGLGSQPRFLFLAHCIHFLSHFNYISQLILTRLLYLWMTSFFFFSLTLLYPLSKCRRCVCIFSLVFFSLWLFTVLSKHISVGLLMCSHGSYFPFSVSSYDNSLL